MDNKEEIIAEFKSLPKEKQEQVISELQKLAKDKSALKAGELMPLKEYMDFGVNELTKSTPKRLIINGAEHKNFGDTWTSFMIHCVKYFIEQGDIKKDFEPLSNGNGKLILIPSLSLGTQDNKDHKFDKVTPFCYLDTKYKVKDHLKNLITIMQHFCIAQDYKIELAIYWNK